MEMIVTRLIEIGIIVLLAGSFYIWNEVTDIISYNKWEKEWMSSSFEFNGVRYNKKFFEVVDGKLCQINTHK